MQNLQSVKVNEQVDTLKKGVTSDLDEEMYNNTVDLSKIEEMIKMVYPEIYANDPNFDAKKSLNINEVISSLKSKEGKTEEQYKRDLMKAKNITDFYAYLKNDILDNNGNNSKLSYKDTIGSYIAKGYEPNGEYVMKNAINDLYAQINGSIKTTVDPDKLYDTFNGKTR